MMIAVPAGAQHAADLEQRRLELAARGEVVERRRRHHQVEGAVAQAEAPEVGHHHLQSGAVEAHPRAARRAQVEIQAEQRPPSLEPRRQRVLAVRFLEEVGLEREPGRRGIAPALDQPEERVRLLPRHHGVEVPGIGALRGRGSHIS